MDLLNEEFDVAVIGAGPMGSFTATRIAQAGFKVILLEKDKVPGDSTVCAGGMHRDVADFVSIPPFLIEKKIRNFRLITDGHIDDWAFPQDTYLMINRQGLDRFLAERSQNFGVTLITNALVNDIKPVQKELLFLNRQTRKNQVLKAKFFIFADGPNTLSKKILSNRPEKKRFEWIGVEYDIHFPDHDFNRIEIVTNSKKLPLGYFWIFPKKDHLNIGLGRLSIIQGHSLWELLNDFMSDYPNFKERPIIRRKGGIIPATINQVIQKNNCLVIGDAAGMVNPLTGGGYICGFLSAKLAAESFNKSVLKNSQSYKRKIFFSKHYLAIRLAYYLLYGIFLVYKLSKKSFYPMTFRLYISCCHHVMRFSKVL